ncbi:hypothetical protein POSPLADRAFT_1054288 [Postia placenta MAD-698-R-SB12]|uniref:Peptidase A1 domain-containing protein n=1 Tax=Postia placenta MAD-698-R-SB12 TaxID=670580 RepID=A0A1X6NAB9_9APHY|nr:hypothetical protein POSPLADRAFT_1054288 [Postia placenta MAD-698-R-SB12]OSX65551.1 hypothetical protein POSPLADRAFT_1054288 [Postia placenta MAD-698-R-SB12]
MFCKASLLTVALALIASATPITKPAGIRIPIQKRSGLTKADGTADRDAILRERVRVQNKHRNNLITIDRKMGLENYHVGAHIPPVATLPEHLQKRQSESLTDQQSEEWTGTVAIGSQSFIIDFDTGSSDLWVPSSDCSSCQTQDTYDPSSSSSSEEQSGTFAISYGDGSTASGPIYKDHVESVAGVSVTGQTFSAVTSESGDLVGGPFDGLMGMAWPALSELNADPFFWTAISQGVVSEGVFGFYLSDSDSELYLGGTNSSLYTGDLEYHDLVSSAGFWTIGGASAIVNGQTVNSDFETIIDSGTTLMYGPTDAVAKFYSGINGAQSLGSGLYGIPCDSFPTVAISWGGSTFTISPNAFNLGNAGDGLCYAALGGENFGFGDNVWLLGDTLMQSVYTAFSVDKYAVGFANLA